MLELQGLVPEIGGRNLERTVVARAQVFHALAIDIETDDGHARPRECSRNRQTDIA